MFFRLFLLFTAVPILEIWLLIQIGSRIGAGPAIALVLLTGATGAAVARHQGFQTLRRVQESLAQGVMPAEAMLDGLLILAAGLLLIAPGLITDTAGALLLIPPARNVFKRWLRIRFERWINAGTVHIRYRSF